MMEVKKSCVLIMRLLLLFWTQLPLSWSCFPDYVPDAYEVDIREKAIGSDFIPETVDGEDLAKKRKLHPSSCGCGVQSHPLDAGQLRLENRKVLTLLPLYPWIVLIEFVDSDKKCAGSIINDQFILTNAQCFIEISDYITLMDALFGTKPENLRIDSVRIYANVKNPTDTSYRTSGPVYFAKNVIIHPNFTLKYFADRHVDYDFALVELRDKLDLAVVTPICLPTGPIEYENRDVIATGWGNETNLIRGAPQFFEPHDFQYIRNFGHYFHTRNHICSNLADVQRMQCLRRMKPYIGETGYGGPLMIKGNDNRIYQIGIMSYHRQSGGDLMTKIPDILRFIDYFSKEASWCSAVTGSKPYFPWDNKKTSSRTPPLTCECGTKRATKSGRLQGAKEVQDNNKLKEIKFITEYTFVVLIHSEVDQFGPVRDDNAEAGKDLAWQCTGTLINDRMVLASTDCVFHKVQQWDGLIFSSMKEDGANYDNMVVYDDEIKERMNAKVFIGPGTLPSSGLVSKDHRFSVKEIYLYPQFVHIDVAVRTSSYLTNNIALLVLKDPIDFLGGIHESLPVCLPKIEDPETEFEGEEVTVVGYGRKDFRETLQFAPKPELYDYEVETDDFSDWLPNWEKVDMNGYEWNGKQNKIATILVRDLPRRVNPGFWPFPLALDIKFQDLKNCSTLTEEIISKDFWCLSDFKDDIKSIQYPPDLPVATLMGDFGAPLLHKNGSDKLYQIAMASHSIYHTETAKNRLEPLADSPHFPGLYQKIKGLIPFIEYISEATGAQFCQN